MSAPNAGDGSRRELLGLAGRLAVGLVMAIVCFAGVQKLVDLTVFARAVVQWRVIPDWAAPAVTVVVPSLELGAALAWLLGVHRGRAWRATLALLLAASAMYGLELASGKAPDCGCFGLLKRFVELHDHGVAVLIRNAVLVLAMCLGAAAMRAAAVRAGIGRKGESDGGFTRGR